MSIPRSSPCCDRRRFLKSASFAAGFFAMHNSPELLTAAPGTGPSSGPSPRIRRIEMATSAPLDEMRAFYHQTLGLEVVEESADRLSICAGQTRLTFTIATKEAAAPFYHFAFNIPENKIVAARDWQKRRTPLLPIPPALRDPDFPEDVVNYSHWNAHSVFFFDPAGNVVEYIARHDLDNAAEGDFHTSDILYASEIAFVVDDVVKIADGFRKSAALKNYRAEPGEFFGALGDDLGLILLMKRGRVISFDSPRRMAVDVFPTKAVIQGEGPAIHHPTGFPYEIAVEAVG